MLASKLTPKVFNLFTGAPQKILSGAIHYKNVNSSVSPVKWSSFVLLRKYHHGGQDSNLPQKQKSAAQSSLKDNTTKENPKTVKAFLMTPEERQRFLDEFPKILSDLANLDGYELMTETKQWANQVVEYNVPHGKHYRSALLIKMAQEINLNSQNGLELPNLYKIGWTFELLQGFFLMTDDMMDGSTTRRNEPCWYLKDDLGMAAINDGLLCESMAYALLKKYAKGKYPKYEEILDLYHDITLRCCHGQSIDLLISRNKQYNTFTEDTYNKMMAFKNGFWTFYFPTAGALLLNGINDKVIFKSIESLSVDLGIFFSMQDDYLDCYADPKVSGKIGTDIQDGKCTWLMVNALKKANNHQWKTLLGNYGQNCPEKVARVKALYNEMGIPEMYSQAQDKAFKNLDESIASLHPVIPKGPLESIVDVMFKRSS